MNSSLRAIEPRLLPEVVASPKVKREQRAAAGTHGVRFVAGVMNQCSRGSFPPDRVTLLPCCRAAQRQVYFLRFVAVAGIVRGWAQDQKAAGDPLARQGSVPAPQDFAPSIVVEKGAIEIFCSVSLAPGQRRRGAIHRSHQLEAERRGVSRYFREPPQHRQMRGGDRPLPRGTWPIRQKWSERRLLQRLQQLPGPRGDSDSHGESHSPRASAFNYTDAPVLPPFGEFVAPQFSLTEGWDSAKPVFRI